MKVNNQKDTVELSHTARSKRGEKAGVVGKKESEGTGASAAAQIGDSASVSISEEAKAISSAKKTGSAEEINQAKVDRVKSMINSGTYKPDFGKVADKMVNESLIEEMA